MMRGLNVHVLFRFSSSVINGKGDPFRVTNSDAVLINLLVERKFEIRVSSNLRREVGTEGPPWSRNGELAN